ICSTGLHAEVRCGDQPDVPPDVKQKIGGFVEGIAQVFSKLLGNVNVKAEVNTSADKVYQRYKDLDKAQIDHYMFWIFCQNIIQNQNLNPADKNKLMIELYRELLLRPQRYYWKLVKRDDCSGPNMDFDWSMIEPNKAQPDDRRCDQATLGL